MSKMYTVRMNVVRCPQCNLVTPMSFWIVQSGISKCPACNHVSSRKIEPTYIAVRWNDEGHWFVKGNKAK